MTIQMKALEKSFLSTDTFFFHCFLSGNCRKFEDVLFGAVKRYRIRQRVASDEFKWVLTVSSGWSGNRLCSHICDLFRSFVTGSGLFVATSKRFCFRQAPFVL